MTRQTIAPLCAVGLLIVAPLTASADQITLTSPDNSVRVTGEFAGFNQDRYLVDVKGHIIELPVMAMNCDGPDCLGFAPIVQTANAGG